MVVDASNLHPNSIVKYPRTPHLPSSPGATSDDKWASKDALTYLDSGIELITSEKLDGGNLTWSRDHFHGRSIDSGTHAWDTQARAEWAQKRWDIPEGWRVSGESMMARRSVAYDNLPGVFIVFGVWDETNTLLDFDSMTEWAELLDLPVVPLLYRGADLKEATSIWAKTHNTETSEGFVVRDAGRIAYEDFGSKVAKWVRADHVRTSASWRHRDDFALNTFA
jgi:RNA ligase